MLQERQPGVSSARFTLPASAAELLHTDEADDIYYQVLGLRGEYLGGDRSVPVPPVEDLSDPGEVRFRDDVIGNEEVRIAYAWVAAAATQQRQPAPWCRWPRRWASARAWPPRSSRA